MPPRVRVTKESIIVAAIEMIREKGEGALNARALALYMGCSTQPIFSNYASMEELKQDVMKHIYQLYLDFLKQDMDSAKYPLYKSAGMGYIRFAKEEKELFKMFFMRDRSKEPIEEDIDESTQMSIAMIQKNLGISKGQAKQFHLEMWIYVHGIASLLVTSYLPLEWKDISSMLTDVYEGMKQRYLSKEV